MCSLLRYFTSVMTCSFLNREFKKLMSRSLFGFEPKMRLKPKSVSKLIYRSSIIFSTFVPPIFKGHRD